MRPPICKLCTKRFSVKDGGLVRFADFVPLPKRQVGHPRGLEWFCDEHLDAAKVLATLSLSEALTQLRSQLKKE